MELLQQIDSAMFVGGLGLFLFAMHQLESTLRDMSASRLRLFFQRYTGNSINASVVGALATAFVQSSSLVGLMVLAFAGANILTLQSALAVIFGANLGTTMTGWLVATIGFKIDVSQFAYPLIGAGALALVGFKGSVKNAGSLLTSVGLLILGLNVMKQSVDGLATVVDVHSFADLALWQFLVFGVVFAGVAQSSSATMLIALAALNAGVIELPGAAAIAVGADLGTTSTVILGGVVGPAIKKRAAAAHFVFNLTTTVLAFVFLQSLLDAVHALGVRDPLYSLVAFHSLFNLIGVVIFLPCIRPMARLLQRLFVRPAGAESRFVTQTSATITAAALPAMTNEVAALIDRVLDQNRYAFSPPLAVMDTGASGRQTVSWGQPPSDYEQMYRRNKQLEGEILAFASQVQRQPNEPAASERLNQLLFAARCAVHAAKSLSDVHHDLIALRDAADPILGHYLQDFRASLEDVYESLFQLDAENATAVAHDYAGIHRKIQSIHDNLHAQILVHVSEQQLRRDDISTLLNVNRELLSSNTSLLLALQALGLDETEADTLVESYESA